MGVAPKTVVRDRETVPAYKVKLEKVLGLTVSNNAALHCDPHSQTVAYPAGCTVVLLDEAKGRQSHLLNSSKKTITCVSYSADGRYLASGECGHCPSLRVWDLAEGSLATELPGHKYSINCLAFSPSQKYIVSVGSQHDMIVNVWDWKSGVKIASNKVSTKVKAISFAENGSYFVTVGNRHVKFWYLEYSRGSKYKEPVPLMGRSAILGEQRNNDFVDVACGKGEMADSTFAITRSGLLCEFNNRRLLDKWVELRTTSANCMTIGEDRIFIGCADGIVRCFDPHTLKFITTLPRTHYLGVDVAHGLDISHMASRPNNAKYPDAIAITFDEKNNKLTCVYNDHSLYIWDVRDIKRVGKSHSYLYHSACIWGVEMFPDPCQKFLPPGSFATCSSDDTIRIWNIDTTLKTVPDSAYQRNIYSKELLKVLYVDPELNSLKDTEVAEKGENNTAYDGRNGVRAIRVSPDGNQLASGDRAGNIRVHKTSSLEELCLIEAHDAEVLCLEYSRHPLNEYKLLASASRDRLLHVFDVNEEYNFVQTLDDHSSSITSVRFINGNDGLQMVSCGADKSIIFRQLSASPGGQPQFTRVYNAAGKTTLYDMEVDHPQKHILTACQDRNIRVYNVSSGKHSKTFKGSVGEDGSLIKVALDMSGIFVATSCTDKTLCIYDYYSGECMATMAGHSELVTGLRFTNDCTRLISASGDGCVLIWTVPHDMVITMQARLSQQAARIKKPTKITNGNHLDQNDFFPPSKEIIEPNYNDQPGYRFSFGQLPVWAKKELEGVESEGGGVKVAGPKGRWAQRIDQTGISIKSYDSDSIISFPPREKRLDSDGSKEDNSSVDSGAETGRSLLSNSRRDTVILSKNNREGIDFLSCPDSLQEILETDNNKTFLDGKIRTSRGSDISDASHLGKQHHHTDDSSLGSFKYEDVESTEHDGDVEDYSEGESSDTKRPLYMPQHDDNREYPVTNMDANELRKSMRRSKRPDLLMVTGEISSASRSVSGSQSDDDEIATPNSELVLSASSDTLDVIAHREKFLKNTFESLSGNEEVISPSIKGKRSLSSQHHGTQSRGRNNNVIEAAKCTKNDVETLRKREELQRRIEETRRQLQSVGFRSNLKSSQSIQDLSSRVTLSEPKPKPLARHRALQQAEAADGRDGAIRRACSLSDLSCSTPVSSRNQGPMKGGSAFVKPHPAPRHSSNKSLPITRSSSVGVLNQSDSESEASQKSGAQRSLSRVMRPTISSQNKVTSSNKSSSSRRRTIGLTNAYSSINLSQGGNTEDSSSEENQVTQNSKPIPPPRPKSVNVDRPRRGNMGRSGSERDINRLIGGGKVQRSASTIIRPSNVDSNIFDARNSIDVTTVPLNKELIASMSEQLSRAAATVVQLHQRLQGASVDSSERDELLGGLIGAIDRAHKQLATVTESSPPT